MATEERAGTDLNWSNFRASREALARPLVIAHRGVPILAPENTLDSFRIAIQQGADVLETDLRFTQDGTIVLFHDETLERTTNGVGEVAEHTLDQLKKLRTRTPAGGTSSQEIPTLIELLSVTQGRVPLLLELKDERFVRPDYAKRLVQIIQDYDLVDRVAIISFHIERSRQVKALCKALHIGEISLYSPWPGSDVELVGPFWPLLLLNPFYVALAHHRGCVVAPLDPTPEPRMAYYLRLGVDAVLADYPARALRSIEKNRGQRR